MTDTVICKACQKPFSYQRKFRPRIYCDGCRESAYKAHRFDSYNPEYEKWYRENVRKPRRALAAVRAGDERK